MVLYSSQTRGKLMNFLLKTTVTISFFGVCLLLAQPSFATSNNLTRCNATNYKEYIFDQDKVDQAQRESFINNNSFNWCDLIGADLSEQNLQGAILTHLDLKYIKCYKTNFDNADFTNVNLSFADCDGASFRATKFNRTNVSGANFSNTIWNEQTIIDMYTEGLYNDPIFTNAIGISL